MSRRLIVNIRGANAAGKTTLAREVLSRATATQALDLGPMKGASVSGTMMYLPGLKLPVFLLGRYDDSKYSGCDKIKSADAIEEAVRYMTRSTPDCHIMFEGFRVSKSYTRYAALRNELVREFGVTWLWVFLHLSHADVCARSEARREASSRPIDKKELQGVVNVMNNTRTKVRQAFPNDHLTLDPVALRPHDLADRLLAEMVQREQG